MTDQESLQERIKELECLYDISSLISKGYGLNEVLPKICDRLSLAFQYPEITLVKIDIKSVIYGRGDMRICNSTKLSQGIYYQNERIGSIVVGLTTSNQGSNPFLTEEEKLLKKVSQEVAFLYERQQRSENEALLNEIVRRQDRLTILGEITAGVAHELNTPLGNVLGFSEFILDSTRDPRVLDDAIKIKKSALHAREIVKKLMFFSCEVPQNLGDESLSSMVEEAIGLLSPLLKQSEVKIELIDRNPSALVTIDKVQFIQVLFNLLNNAIQASKPSDQIIVDLSQKNGCATITIQDFGHGIPVEIQERIFEPFFTYNKKDKGNGLGLSVVHGIIKQHKGRIQFTSEPNQGTTFVISIPQTI